MHSFKKSFFILLCGFVINIICYGQKNDSKINTRTSILEHSMQQILDSAGIPGISIALINNGELIWNKGFGVSNKEAGTKVAESTIFPAASLGKPVFAYAVLKMADMKKLYLDSAITSYVPLEYLEDAFLKGKLADENIKLITPRMILSHSSGLPNWRNPGEPIKTLFKPGNKYSYSGEGYFLLQLIIEYITKEPIEKIMRNLVFTPLLMTHSTYLFKDSGNYTSTYGNDSKAVPLHTDEPANVAHTFKTNAADYARFIIAIQNGKGLMKTTFSDMLRPQIATDICESGKISWGLGFAIQHTPNGNAYFQWGKSPNASGYFISFNNSKNAVVYFTNIANQGLRIGEKIVKETLDYQDPLFACFRVKQYNK